MDMRMFIRDSLFEFFNKFIELLSRIALQKISE